MHALAEGLRSLWVVWLLVAFAAVVLWAWWPGNRNRFRRDAEIPFSEDEERGR